MSTRREFLKQALTGTAALSLGGLMPGLSNKSYGSVLGANDKIRVGAIGVNSRGMALATNFAMQPGCEVVHICDVDSRHWPNAPMRSKKSRITRCGVTGIYAKCSNLPRWTSC